MRFLQLDHNHPLISEQLSPHGFTIEDDFHSSYDQVLEKIDNYDGIIIRSRIPVDRNFLDKASALRVIARVGAGMENIDVVAAEEKGVILLNAPEGNRDAVAEHVLGMLLMLLHRFNICCNEVKCGIWKREENRGDELLGKTVGLIGYGNMGKATAKRFAGFGCRVIFYDILSGLEDDYAQQVSLSQIKNEADVISLHIPLTADTMFLIKKEFIDGVAKPFYLINTSRGKNVETSAVIDGVKSGKIKGAALDVLEYEKSSFENLESESDDLKFLLQSDKIVVTPHIAGWTHQSKMKMAQVIVDKILANFK